MTELRTAALDGTTWLDFAELVEANNGIWGGCWCMWYHRKDRGETPAEKRAAKEQLVREGRAHAALVFDGTACVGWCQFGSPEEMPCIHNERAYFATNPQLPDWRITCFFSGKGYRGKTRRSPGPKSRPAVDSRLLGGEGAIEETLFPRFCLACDIGDIKRKRRSLLR